MVFKGIWTSIVKERYSFVMFQGRGSLLPVPSSRFVHDLEQDMETAFLTLFTALIIIGQLTLNIACEQQWCKTGCTSALSDYKANESAHLLNLITKLPTRKNANDGPPLVVFGSSLLIRLNWEKTLSGLEFDQL